MVDDAPDWEENESTTSEGAVLVPVVVTPPLTAYLRALERYEGLRLYEIHRALGLADPGAKPRALAGIITERLAEPRFAERILATLELGPRLATSLFMLTETTSWSLNGLFHALSCLGVEPTPTVHRLLELGLVAIELAEGNFTNDLARLIERGAVGGARFLAHPSVLSASRTVLPEPPLTAYSGTVNRIRETDGLEPILRLAAVWQRVDEGPLRRTQHGTLYKRDRDRLEDDPVLAGPIADALEPLPDMAAFWLALSRGVSLLIDEENSDRVVAAPPDFWAENAIHLPQMVATRWLALRTWHEQGGIQQEGSTVELALPYLRPVVLLWLATLAEGEWVAIADFDARLREYLPDWDRAGFLEEPAANPAARAKALRAAKSARPARESRTEGTGAEPAVLESLLLGAAYQLGLVRAAVDGSADGRAIVQLSALGRYILALGPPPPPRPTFEHFLYVQPNFEIIAYRQGLTPPLIGQFSRFALWSQVGAALELKLTAESVYRGLEGGLSPPEMLDRLARHSQRVLPAGVSEAVRTWAGRRERITYYASATLVEFATKDDLEKALAQWPESAGAAPIAISDRLLLVEDDSSIPFQRLRLAGARDYRRSPESCLEVEADGVTLSLDLSRSDLLVDAELVRFADELPLDPATGTPGNPRRRFVISPASIARGAANGMTSSTLSHWFARRTDVDTPPPSAYFFWRISSASLRSTRAAPSSSTPPRPTSSTAWSNTRARAATSANAWDRPPWSSPTRSSRRSGSLSTASASRSPIP
ncbi:Helicase conserved C-terminal domain-containing protein [Singulisphaera sp. GP187]|uniref:helicase-associated domain-containing protein n=1 Tax=Singulisphaera sp. GP187 TaxID=1882752 RepID=UPI00092874E0|nr:helicase-associated domain-containing protein [Singulisphaera sp. GP187]SIO06935.1 Helicase conserved C-terminal domain-containing protein [Singulisphaera sp. GP187]